MIAHSMEIIREREKKNIKTERKKCLQDKTRQDKITKTITYIMMNHVLTHRDSLISIHQD